MINYLATPQVHPDQDPCGFRFLTRLPPPRWLQILASSEVVKDWAQICLGDETPKVNRSILKVG
jgi:hypothetical protein